MTTHPHLEGLIPRLRDAAKSASRSGLPGLAVTISVIADDLAALPGGGVEELEECHRHSCKRKAALAQAEQVLELAQLRAVAELANDMDEGHRAEEIAGFAKRLRAIFAPTPNPHEADQS